MTVSNIRGEVKGNAYAAEGSGDDTGREEDVDSGLHLVPGVVHRNEVDGTCRPLDSSILSMSHFKTRLTRHKTSLKDTQENSTNDKTGKVRNHALAGRHDT